MEGGRRRLAGTTDGSGVYQTQLSAGAYSIKASGSGINPGGTTVKVGTQDVTATVRVTRNVTPPPQTQAKVRIQVVDQTRKGVPGATVTVMAGSRRLQTGTTDGSGYYQTQLSPGDYSIKASGTGITPGGTTIKVGTRDTSATVNVTRTVTPGSGTGGLSLKYIAQYLPPGRKAWITIGTYPSRSEAEAAVKLAKIPVKSKTRVIPSSKGSPSRQPLSRILTPGNKASSK